MTKDEALALDLALEALEYWDVHGKLHQPTEEAITAIKQARVAPPVQTVAHGVNPLWLATHPDKLTTPPAAQRQWVGLTQDERLHFLNEILDYGTGFVAPLDSVIRNIEVKLKEKNNGRYQPRESP